jgi:predicted acyltransferase
MSDPKLSSRLLSLDVLRGFDMLFIMGFATLVINVCKLFPGTFADAIAETMQHPAWHGFTHHDTIFPLFLFVAGVSYPFSLYKRQQQGASRAALYGQILRRGATLVLLGLICNGLLQLQWPIRTASVLGRIGIAWAIAAVIYLNFRTKARIALAAVVLIGYWLLLATVVAPDAPSGADGYSMEGTIVGYVDRLFLPGRLYEDIFDPEGLLSTLPAVVTAMLGMMAGEFLRYESPRWTPNKKAMGLLVIAVCLTLIGILWSMTFPLNKKLWTSSFVCVVAGYSFGLLALFYWLIDVKGYKGWVLPFQVIGVNSITIFMAQRILGFRNISNFFLGGVASLLPEKIAPILNSIGYITVCWLFLYFLYRKQIFLKV